MRHPAAAGCLNIQGLIAGRTKSGGGGRKVTLPPHKERAMIKYAYACQVESGKLLAGRQPSPMWMNPS